MLGRQVTAALRRPLQARLRTTTTTTAAPQIPATLCIRTFSHAPRYLIPAGRPRKAVGEPSRPVKRSVKKDAKSSDPDAAAKKLAAKERAAAKKKAAAKKAKPVRELTPEQLERKKLAVQRAQTTELKKVALKPPGGLKVSAWTLFVKEKAAGVKEAMADSYETGVEKREKLKEVLSEHSKRVSAEWKNLSPSELEHYNHLAHTAREAAAAEYKRYVESHTPEEIKLANTARAKLRRRNDRKEARKWPPIEDERIAKKPFSAYIHFSISRHASGDFNHIVVTERAKLIGQEWKALSEEEKQKYQNLAARDLDRYASEESVYSSRTSSEEPQSSYASSA